MMIITSCYRFHGQECSGAYMRGMGCTRFFDPKVLRRSRHGPCKILKSKDQCASDLFYFIILGLVVGWVCYHLGVGQMALSHGCCLKNPYVYIYVYTHTRTCNG